MTPEQFSRWRDFATRMAKVCYADSTDPSGTEILSNVESFLDGLSEEDIPCIVDWDNSDPYPEGSKYRRAERTYQCPCGYRKGYSGGYTKPKKRCKNCQGTGTATHWAAPYGVGDMCGEAKESWNPYYWSAAGDDDDPVDDRPRYLGGAELYGPFFRPSYEDTDDQYCGPVLACLRAGLDCASSPSMGVLGFTAGDLRRMYPEGVPDWVKGDTPWNSIPVKGVIPGVGFVPGEPCDPKSFDELPDEAEIWI